MGGNKLQSKTELRIQQECYMWFYNNYPHLRGCFFKVKNEGTNKITGAIDKATGLIAGVADMILLANKTAYLFEFKTHTGRQSEAQKKWEKKIVDSGYMYCIIKDFENFKSIIKIII